jgi:hypothetical protein
VQQELTPGANSLGSLMNAHPCGCKTALTH